MERDSRSYGTFSFSQVETSRPARRERRGVLNGRLPRRVASPAGEVFSCQRAIPPRTPRCPALFPPSPRLVPRVRSLLKRGNGTRTCPEKHSPGSGNHSPRIETRGARGTPRRAFTPAPFRGERPGKERERDALLSPGIAYVAQPASYQGNSTGSGGMCNSLRGMTLDRQGKSYYPGGTPSPERPTSLERQKRGLTNAPDIWNIYGYTRRFKRTSPSLDPTAGRVAKPGSPARRAGTSRSQRIWPFRRTDRRHPHAGELGCSLKTDGPFPAGLASRAGGSADVRARRGRARASAFFEQAETLEGGSGVAPARYARRLSSKSSKSAGISSGL
jgi:hypothetical protein